MPAVVNVSAVLRAACLFDEPQILDPDLACRDSAGSPDLVVVACTLLLLLVVVFPDRSALRVAPGEPSLQR